MGDIGGSGGGGFETAFKLVGGHGRFQWLCLAVCSLQLLMMTWNHMGYIFIGAVPHHWCHIRELDHTPWTLEQIKNLSIPTISHKHDLHHAIKYDECHFYNINYTHIVSESGGNFDLAYHLIFHVDEFDYYGDEEGDGDVGHGLSKSECQEWTFDKSLYSSTIVSDFNLVCGRRYLVATIQASYMMGAFVGTLVFGPLNDRILGRRRAALIGIVLVLIGGFLTCLSTSYVMFIVTRLLVAIGTAGCMQASSIWFLEHCDTKGRAKLYCIGSMFFGVGYALMSVYAYYIRDWATLQVAFSVTTLSLLSYYWIFPESPRWLASRGEDAAAVEALLRIAKINGRDPPPSREELLRAVQHCHYLDQKENHEDSKTNEVDKTGNGDRAGKRLQTQLVEAVINFKSLLSTRQLVKISCTMWILFVAVAFVYYGFAFSTNLTSNPYMLVALGALMEVPSAILPIPFLTRWGRRPTTIVCYLITGLSALAIAITPADYETVRTLLSMTGKLFVATAFTVLYLVVSEVYPTVVRSTGQGAGTLMGRFGSIAAPYVADLLTTVYPDLPCVIFGIVALIASGVAFLIPEMKDVDMKDQVYEYSQA